MSKPLHWIDNLQIEVDGLLDKPMGNELKQLIPEVLETCFNNYDTNGKTLYIDRIELDLGSIKKTHLKEEFKVRLMYLVRQELDKLFRREDFNELIEESAIHSTMETITHYLQSGYSRGREEDLSALFEQLLHSDFEQLEQILERSTASKTVQDRLFYQIRFSLLERYWHQKYPKHYKAIQQINEGLLKEFRTYSDQTSEISSLRSAIRKHTFLHLFGSRAQQNTDAYIRSLRKHLDQFKKTTRSFDQKLDRFFQQLQKKEEVPPIREQEDAEDSWIERLSSHLLDEIPLTPIELDFCRKKIRSLPNVQLSNLINQVIEDPSHRNSKMILAQLFLLMETRQLHNFLVWHSQKFGDQLAKASAKWLYFKWVVEEVFQQNLLNYSTEKVVAFLIAHLNSKDDSHLIRYFLVRVSIEKVIPIQEVLERLSNFTQTSFNEYAIVFHRQLNLLQQSFGKSASKLLNPENYLNQYVHYLKTGKWELEIIDPDDLLKSLLDNEKETLYQSLYPYVQTKSMWQRLISKHKASLSWTVMHLFLSTEKSFAIFNDRVKNLKSTHQREPIFHKLLLAYIATKSEVDETVFREQLSKAIVHATNLSEEQLFDKTRSRSSPNKELTNFQPSTSSDEMSNYLQFLQSGRWTLAKYTPLQVLQHLLQNSPEHLVLLLSRYLSSEIIWTRLIYQTPVDVVEQVIRLVFGNEEIAQILEDLLARDFSLENTRFLQKVLEAYIVAKREVENGSDLSLEELVSLRIDALQTGNNGTLEPDILAIEIPKLRDYLISANLQEVPKELLKAGEQITAFPHRYYELLMDSSISDDRWTTLFMHWQYSDFLDFFEGRVFDVISKQLPENELLHLLLSLPKVEMEKVIEKNALSSLVVFSLRNQYNKLQDLLQNTWRSYQENNQAAFQSLTTHETIKSKTQKSRDQEELSLLSIHKSFNKKEYADLLDAIYVLSEEVDTLHIPIDFLELKGILLNQLPFAGTVSALKRALVSTLYQDIPDLGWLLVNNQKVRYFRDTFIEIFLSKLSTDLNSLIGFLSPREFLPIEKVFLQLTVEKKIHFEKLFSNGHRSLTKFFQQFSEEGLAELEKLTATQITEISDWVLQQKSLHPQEPAKEIKKASKGSAVPQKADLKDFTSFILDYINGGKFSPTTYFKNEKTFEDYLLHFIKNKPGTQQLFSEIEEARFIAFVSELSDNTQTTLSQFFQHRISSADQKTFSTHALKANEGQAQSVNQMTLVYLMRNQALDQTAYHFFLARYIDDFQIPIDESQPKEKEAIISSKLYVTAFLHFLRYQRHIHISVEQDGPQVAMHKVLTYWLDELVQQLKIAIDQTSLLEQLFEMASPSGEEPLFRKLVHTQQGTINYVVHQLQNRKAHPEQKGKASSQKSESTENLISTSIEFEGKKKGVFDQRAIFIAWIRIVFKNRSRLSGNQLISAIRSMIGKDQIVSDLKPAKSHQEDDLSIDRSLRQAIKPSYQDQYGPLDLIKEVIKEGRFPSWSAIHSTTTLLPLLEEIIKTNKESMLQFMDRQFKTAAPMDRFISLVTPVYFEQFFANIFPAPYKQLVRVTPRILALHSRFGSEKNLKYFIQKTYFLLFFQQGHSKGIVGEPQVFNHIIKSVQEHFGLNDQDYHHLLTGEIPSEYTVEEDREQTLSAQQPIDQQYLIDLLIHLSKEGSLPWWGKKNSKYTAASTDKLIAQLSMDLLDLSPDLLIEEIKTSGAAFVVYEAIVPSLSIAYFDRLLLALKPDLGGFIISFNLLLNSWKSNTSDAQWKSQLIQLLLNHVDFNVVSFLQMGISYHAKALGLPVTQLIKNLQAKAIELNVAGEARFKPFAELLTPLMEEEQSKADHAEDIDIAEDRSDLPQFWSNTAILMHYLHTGALPHGQNKKIAQYKDLIEVLELIAQQEGERFRLQLMASLSNARIRERLVKEEKEHFLWTILKILGIDHRRLFALKESMTKLLLVKWPSVTRNAIKVYFYQSIFEQILKANQSVPMVDEMVLNTIANFTEKMKAGEVVFGEKDLQLQSFDSIFIRHYLAIQEKKRKKQKKRPSPVPFEIDENALLDQRTKVLNAGVVIFWPYLTRYFEMLEMLEGPIFKTDEHQIKAVQLVHYLSTGLTEAPEHEMILSKVLCGVKIATPVPMEFDLSEQEKELTTMMMKGVLQNWEKLKSSSPEALREGFLIRDGFLFEKEKIWELEVEKKTLDVLMQSLPWSLGTIKLPWMEKRLIVEWL